MINLPIFLWFLIPSSFLILIISIYLFFSKERNRVGLILLLIGISQFFWMLSILASLKVYDIGLGFIGINFTIKILPLAVFLIPALLYHFSIEFCKLPKQKIWLYLIYVISLGLVFFNNPNTILKQIFLYEPNTINVWLDYAFIFFVIILLFVTMYNFISTLFFRDQPKEKRKEIFTYTVLIFGIYGLIFLYFFFSFENISSILSVFYIFIPIYLLIFSFINIEKKSIFQTIITTDIMVGAVFILLASLIIFPELKSSQAIELIAFALIVTMGFLLIRYVNRLANQKDEFEKMLNDRTRELKESNQCLFELNKQLEEANTILEIKVQARTRALKELNDDLERQIQERTKELENKNKELEEKIKELKDFSNIFINRENKMVELKEKIYDLEEKIKELENYQKK